MRLTSAIPLLGLLTYVAATPVTLDTRGGCTNGDLVRAANDLDFACTTSDCSWQDNYCSPHRCTQHKPYHDCFSQGWGVKQGGGCNTKCKAAHQAGCHHIHGWINDNDGLCYDQNGDKIDDLVHDLGDIVTDVVDVLGDVLGILGL